MSRIEAAIARAGGRVAVVGGPAGAWRIVAFPPSDGWGPARLLVALAASDARGRAARGDAAALRKRFGDRPSLLAVAVHDACRAVVPFGFERGEVFGATAARGDGDCDDQARWIASRLGALGIPWRLGFLSRPTAPPQHVWCEVLLRGRWRPLEATIRAHAGEHPQAAVVRLGLPPRADLQGTETSYMAESDLPPPPAGYDPPWTDAELLADERGLNAAGYPVAPSACRPDPRREEFRRAVLAFQRRHRLTPDGLIGPETRGALAAVLAPPVRRYTHARALADLMAAAALENKTLTPAGARLALGTAHGETFYGRGASKFDALAADWAHLDQFGRWAQAGGLNWGALEYDHRRGAENPGPFFADLRPRGAIGKDGRNTAGFYLFGSDVDAARAFLRTWAQADTLAAANRGDAYGVAEAMMRHGYYTGNHCGPTAKAAWCLPALRMPDDASARDANVRAYQRLIERNARAVDNPDAGPHDSFVPRGPAFPPLLLVPLALGTGVALATAARLLL